MRVEVPVASFSYRKLRVTLSGVTRGMGASKVERTFTVVRQKLCASVNRSPPAPEPWHPWAVQPVGRSPAKYRAKSESSSWVPAPSQLGSGPRSKPKGLLPHAISAAQTQAHPSARHNVGPAGAGLTAFSEQLSSESPRSACPLRATRRRLGSRFLETCSRKPRSLEQRAEIHLTITDVVLSSSASHRGSRDG